VKLGHSTMTAGDRDRRPEWRSARAQSISSGVSDPFAVNPIRRSAGLVAICLVVLIVPWLISEQFGTTVMLALGWLAVTGLVMGLPILIWSLAEEGIRLLRRRVHPSVEQLKLSPRVEHILLRHGLTTVRDVDQTPDDGLLLLSNMDQRGLREIRRAITLWKYQRWQESGFAAADD
jgi:hypothetical protein